MSIDRQTALSGTKDVAPALAFDTSSLARWMKPLVGLSGPIEARQFKGGQSNPTYQIATEAGPFALRRKPPGKLLPSAHAVDREFRVLTALHANGFPVPAPIGFCADPDVIGTPFYLMAHVEGRVFWDVGMPLSTPLERAAVFDAMNATIARLHSLDPTAIGLSDFGRAEGYVARQVRRWSQQYRASETETILEMDRLIAWLPDRVPSTSRPALVHGDYRLDNIILHPTEPRVLAVIDWELATLGDPFADFVYHLMSWMMPPVKGGGAGSLVGRDLSALGIPDMERYAADYARRMGVSDIPHLEILLAYNFFRIAAILQGIVGRIRDGTASNEHARRAAMEVRPLAEEAWRWARKAGAH